MYFFTADQHYGHRNIIKYCNRPFSSIEEMDEALIENHNRIVKEDDIVINVGDFTLAKQEIAKKYIERLNGRQVFIRGSHDVFLGNTPTTIWEKRIEGYQIVACHYAMRVWPRSHYGSILAFGHSHGKLKPIGKQWDVGVDNNKFRPISVLELIEKVKDIPIYFDNKRGENE